MLHSSGARLLHEMTYRMVSIVQAHVHHAIRQDQLGDVPRGRYADGAGCRAVGGRYVYVEGAPSPPYI